MTCYITLTWPQKESISSPQGRTILHHLQLQLFFILRHTVNAKESNLCILKLIGNQPNGHCSKSKIIMEEIFIPFSSVDIHGESFVGIIVKWSHAWLIPDIEMKRAFTYLGCNMNFLRDIFGWQHFEIYFSVIVCILMSILLCTCLTTGHSYKVSTNCLHGRIVSSHYT